MPNEGEELDIEKTVFRLVRDIPRFVPHGMRFPNGDAFRPSQMDEDDAEQTGKPVRVSVWDLELTTVPQARAFRSTNDVQRPFALRVSDVAKVRQQMQEARLRVVADPLDEGDGPGAAGHCGIEGLDRLPGGQKKVQRAILDALAAEVVELADNGEPLQQS